MWIENNLSLKSWNRTRLLMYNVFAPSLPTKAEADDVSLIAGKKAAASRVSRQPGTAAVQCSSIATPAMAAASIVVWNCVLAPSPIKRHCAKCRWSDIASGMLAKHRAAASLHLHSGGTHTVSGGSLLTGWHAAMLGRWQSQREEGTKTWRTWNSSLQA